MTKEESYVTRRWTKQLDEIDREIGKLALLCDVPILDPGIIERVLDNDATVCGKPNPTTFATMRNLLMMHYSVRSKAVVALGPEEARQMVEQIVARLRARFGDRLGKPAA